MPIEWHDTTAEWTTITMWAFHRPDDFTRVWVVLPTVVVSVEYA